MNPLDDFLKAVRNGLAKEVEEQISLPANLTDPTLTLSEKFYTGVPTASLFEYLRTAEEKEEYALCALIRNELERRRPQT